MRVNHNPKVLGTLALALLLPAAGAWAQTGGNAAPSGQIKIGILNVRQAIVTTGEGKQASAQLQTQFSAQQNDLQNMQKQISDLQNKVSNSHGTLSDDEQGRLQRQGELLSRQFQRKQDDLNEAVNAAQSDVIDNIGRKMLRARPWSTPPAKSISPRILFACTTKLTLSRRRAMRRRLPAVRRQPRPRPLPRQERSPQRRPRRTHNPRQHVPL